MTPVPSLSIFTRVSEALFEVSWLPLVPELEEPPLDELLPDEVPPEDLLPEDPLPWLLVPLLLELPLLSESELP